MHTSTRKLNNAHKHACMHWNSKQACRNAQVACMLHWAWTEAAPHTLHSCSAVLQSKLEPRSRQATHCKYNCHTQSKIPNITLLNSTRQCIRTSLPKPLGNPFEWFRMSDMNMSDMNMSDMNMSGKVHSPQAYLCQCRPYGSQRMCAPDRPHPQCHHMNQRP